MMTGQEKSQKRREDAAKAIAALRIPGVATTRNLEAWLIRWYNAGAATVTLPAPPWAAPIPVPPVTAKGGDE